MVIALGAAKGLAFLHNAERPVIYRDFKTSNILLDSVSAALDLFINNRLLTFFKQTLPLSLISIIERKIKDLACVSVQDYTAKLSDFGLAKAGPQGDETHVSTRVMGTYGYMLPLSM